MEQENEKLLIAESLEGLRAYAGHLARTDLNANMESIEQIRFLSEVMASYHCLEGYEADLDERIQNKYVRPLERLLEGGEVETPAFNEAHREAIINGLDYYREELEMEDEPVYEKDISLCIKFTDEMNRFQMPGESHDWSAKMQF